jgi:hypothetical protein
MKVGDIVRQGNRLVKMKGRKPSVMLGVVVEMTDTEFPDHLSGWTKFIGKSVTVMWANGKLHKNFAENSLEVISEGR